MEKNSPLLRVLPFMLEVDSIFVAGVKRVGGSKIGTSFAFKVDGAVEAGETSVLDKVSLGVGGACGNLKSVGRGGGRRPGSR